MTPRRVTEKKKIDTAKNVRAVNGLLKQIEWLGWEIVWETEGFVYKEGKERVVPQGLLVSETQRRINKVERFPLAAKQVLGDVQKWQEQIEGLLNRAKYFASLGVPDFESLKSNNGMSLGAQEKRFAELLNLLEAEAICFNSLPASPCRLLAEIIRTNSSSTRCAAIERYIRSRDKSSIARALAALALGTAADAQMPEFRKEESKEIKAWINRCIRWGQGARDSKIGKRQLAIDPVLLVLLLETDSGSTNTTMIAKLKEELVYFHLPLAEFKLLLRSGTSSDTVFEIAMQFQLFEKIGEKLLVYRNLIPESGDIRTRKKVSKKLEWQRSSSLDKLRSALVKLIQTQAGQPTVTVGKLLAVTNDLLGRYSVSRKLVTEIATVAQHAASLDSSLRNEFLDILREHHDMIWAVENDSLPVESQASTQAASVESDGEEAASVKSAAALQSKSAKTVAKKSAIAQAAVEPTAIASAALEPTEVEKPNSTEHRGISSKSRYCGGSLQQVFDVISNTESPSLARRGLVEGTLAYLSASKFKDPVKSDKFLQWCQRIEFSEFGLVWSLINVMNALPQWHEIEPLLENFVKAVEKIPLDLRSKYYQVIDDFSKKKRELRSDLITAAEFMPRLVEITKVVESCRCTCYVLMRIALHFGRKLPRLAPDLQNWLADFYTQQKSVEHSHGEYLERGCEFGVIFVSALLEGPVWQAGSEDFDNINFTLKVEEIVSTFVLHNIETHSQAITDGILVLEENALLARLSLEKFKTQPHRCMKLFANLGATRKLSGTTKEPFKALEGFRAKERALAALARNGSQCVKLEIFDRHVVKRLCSKGWSGTAERAPHLVPDITSYICSRSITKEPQEPPQAVLKVLSMKDNLVKEKIHLESKLTRSEEASDNGQSLRARLKNLEQRLADDAGIEQQVKRLIEKQVHHLCSEAEMCALEHVVDEVIRNHLRALIGAQAKDIVIDSFLLNAILLTQDVDMNKRLLRKLIKAHIDGDCEWRHRIPANQKLLELLKEEGTEPDIWLGSHLRSFKLDGIKGGIVNVHLETDAIKILEMGNYFDTCLSFGGVNSFSTVTNAVDLNKRVVYAFDKQGTAIGRKLIGLNEEGKLIGYRTYTSIENKETDEKLKKLINDYVKDFARMCNLTLSSEGTVPSITTKFWYDDGVEAWLEEEAVRTAGDTNKKGCRLPGRSASLKSLESHAQI